MFGIINQSRDHGRSLATMFIITMTTALLLVKVKGGLRRVNQSGIEKMIKWGMWSVSRVF